MPEEKPQSNTPNFNELEKGVLKFWEENKIFEKSLEKTKDGEPYIFYDGPPFATGLPHYGSLLPSIIKDAIPRYQTMKGRFVRRRWGWDCHGLPIENIVEQHLKISGKKQIEEIGVDRFNQICRDNVLTYAKEWGKTISRIGRWVEFDNAYMTMQTSYQESVWAGLKQIWEKGLIYEDRKVLLYCSRCETPISNFEVAMDNSYKDVTEESVFAKFKLLKGQRIINDLTNDKTYALAWTTTPWTLPGNTALNVGPDILYVMIEMAEIQPDFAKASTGKERYILAKERLSVIDGAYETIAEFPARSLEGLQYEPLYPGVIQDPKNRAHRIYAADFVTITDGTGIVHNAAMYGEEDYQLAKEKDLPRVDMLDNKGHYLPMAPEHLRGVFFKGADKIILKELKEQGKVYKTLSYTHSYPHCYRCATPLFYNALPAWFINIQKVKAELLKNNEDVNWYPEHLKHGRFKLGLENAPDWNISRNRYWATALPFWKCENLECKNLVCVGSVAELQEQSLNFAEVYPNYRVEESGKKEDNSSLLPPPSSLESLDLHRPYIDNIKLKCEKCQSSMQRIPEVVDCWVESGSMPFAELHYPFENNGELPLTPSLEKRGNDHSEDFKNRFPADFVVEYIPQTRAWFYVMHVMSSILFERAPFKNVLTTGTILAEDGTKMSKSKKNYPDPSIIIEKYGADALRFYLLTSPVVNGEDINFSEKIVAETGRKINMLVYNVWSFYRMYEKGAILPPSSSLTPTNILDQWIIARLNQTHAQVTKFMDVFDTVRAGKEIVDFINDMSTWYLRRSRDRIKNGGDEAKQALSTLGFVLIEVSKLLAPFTPFLADFIYKDLTGEESVHLTSWSVMGSADEKVLADMEVVREVVTIGLSARKEKSLAVRQPLAALAFDFADSKVSLAVDFNKIILEEMNVKIVDLKLLDKDLRGQGVVVMPGAKAVKNFYLDINISPELKKEGVARELERQVQDLRKKSGLKVGELADIYYNTLDESLEDSLLNLVDRKKTFVSQISKSLEVEVDYETQATVDGKAIWMGILRI